MPEINNLFKKLSQLQYPWPVKITVTAVVIYLVDRSLTKDQVPLLFKSISLIPISIAFIVGCMGFYFQVGRWRLILSAWGISASTNAALCTMLWGCLLAFITPGRTGELFRGISLPAAKKSHTVYAVLVDKIFSGGAVLAAGVICCAISLARSKAACWGHWVIIIGAISVAAFAAVVFALRSHSIVRTALNSLPAFSARRLILLVSYSIIAHILLLIQTAVLFSMFGSNGLLDNVIACGQAFSFMLFFPFFIANMGIREYSFGMFLGLSPASLRNTGILSIAFGASMCILIINIILPALIGLLWWLLGQKYRKCPKKPA
jgi:hypothetical protein